MKTLTVSQAKPRLARLVDEAHAGAPIVLIHNDKLVKLERYEPLDPEYDSAQIEESLLQAVLGPHSPYCKKDLETVARKVRQQISRK